MPKAKILVLEDAAGRSGPLRQRLIRLGYSVVSTRAAEAIRKTAEMSPDLVLIDIRPGRGPDRAALAEVLRARFKTPLVLVASPADKKKLVRTGQISSSECVTRPFVDSELRTSLVTALKKHRTEASPPGNESWCHSVVRNIRDAVVVTERTGLTVFLNPAAEKLTGWKLDDATGRPLSEIFQAFGENDGRPISVPFGKIIRRRPAGLPEHLILATKEGAKKHVESSVSALWGAEGRTMGVVLVLRDVTERNLMTRSTLARQKMEAIGTLAHGMSHDFGILIGRIDAQVSSLADSLIPKTAAHEATMKIVETTKEARELTSHLADLALASKPRSRRTISSVSISQAVADAEKALEKTFSDRRIRFLVDAPAKKPFVKADAAQLLDSLMCVFLNSVEAMPDGGTLTVRISVKNVTRPKPRFSSEARKGRYAVLSIVDTGQGMSRETLSRIFEPFFTTKQRGLMKGLGMTIVHATILSWGGWIAVQSAPGKGTTVNLYIPAAEVPALSAAGPAEGGKTILLVDDSESDLTLFRTILEEQGYRVHTAANGADGLNKLHGLDANVDLVIVDLIMPHMDGREVFRKIIEKDPDKSVIMTSGFSRDYVRSYLGQGSWGFVQKPIEKDQLLHAVSRALEQRVVLEGAGSQEEVRADADEKTTG